MATSFHHRPWRIRHLNVLLMLERIFFLALRYCHNYMISFINIKLCFNSLIWQTQIIVTVLQKPCISKTWTLHELRNQQIFTIVTVHFSDGRILLPKRNSRYVGIWKIKNYQTWTYVVFTGYWPHVTSHYCILLNKFKNVNFQVLRRYVDKM